MQSLIGKNVILRTVTYHHVGRLVALSKHWLTLEQASWVADSGRWHDALTSGNLDEVEPFPNLVHIGVGTVIDVTEWTHPLPTAQK